MLEQQLAEKNRIIEELNLQLDRKSEKIDQLEYQVGDLHEKHEGLLEFMATKKRELLYKTEDKRTPTTKKPHTD
ncbi:hypothetical protein KJ966_03655 [bacterium]|nr:hypothetical protein [bacterium]